MAVKERRNSLDYAWSINPGQSQGAAASTSVARERLRLAFEVFHDIQKPVVHIGLIDEAHLNLVQIAQRVLTS